MPQPRNFKSVSWINEQKQSVMKINFSNCKDYDNHVRVKRKWNEGANKTWSYTYTLRSRKARQRAARLPLGALLRVTCLHANPSNSDRFVLWLYFPIFLIVFFRRIENSVEYQSQVFVLLTQIEMDSLHFKVVRRGKKKNLELLDVELEKLLYVKKNWLFGKNNLSILARHALVDR